MNLQIRENIVTRFSGHETFTLRYTWLPKAVHHIKSDPELFSREDAMVSLGVGKNMVRSIRHWALAFGVLEDDPNIPNNRGRTLRLSQLGEALFGDDGIDPYLENMSTLWLLHYNLVSKPDSPTTWFYAFNLFPRMEFSSKQLLDELQNLNNETENKKVSSSIIQRDINCFIRTYVPPKKSKNEVIEDTLDCPFVELALLRETTTPNSFCFCRGTHSSLPTEILVFALLDFWDTYNPGINSLKFEDIAYEVGSPGRVFKLSEVALSEHLHKLDTVTKGALRFDSTAGLSQVYRSRDYAPQDALKNLRSSRSK
ncbi:hypothetical protein Pan241w_26370 [Gimesia alba]|uniref:DUF4007 domain-containing protein n=2 Tax=Gimesia alba TaxID=2527973 RepID=A0A517RF93_9PLAN|nr:hypothetical protein Pan241w_26370 [Gimesia alba]